MQACLWAKHVTRAGEEGEITAVGRKSGPRGRLLPFEGPRTAGESRLLRLQAGEGGPHPADFAPRPDKEHPDLRPCLPLACKRAAENTHAPFEVGETRCGRRARKSGCGQNQDHSQGQAGLQWKSWPGRAFHALSLARASRRSRGSRADAQDGKISDETLIPPRPPSAVAVLPASQERAPFPRWEAAEEAVGVQDTLPFGGWETAESAVAIPQSPTQAGRKTTPGTQALHHLFSSCGRKSEPATGCAQ